MTSHRAYNACNALPAGVYESNVTKRNVSKVRQCAKSNLDSANTGELHIASISVHTRCLRCVARNRSGYIRQAEFESCVNPCGNDESPAGDNRNCPPGIACLAALQTVRNCHPVSLPRQAGIATKSATWRQFTNCLCASADRRLTYRDCRGRCRCSR